MQTFSVEAFEGPLDLLLHLIHKSQIDIYDIPIAEITAQYIAYLDRLDKYDLEGASEFVAMASQLLEIKSREMLPKGEAGDGEETDPRAGLVEKLAEYRQIKHIAAFLRAYEEEYLLVVGKDPSFFEELPPSPEDFCVQEGALLFALKRALLRTQNSPPKAAEAYAIPTAYIAVEEKVEWIQSLLQREKRLSFFELLSSATGRDEAIALFLAILELYKDNSLQIGQEGAFGDILLEERVS